MYRKVKATVSNIVSVIEEIGESIEEKVRRITENGEPITDGAQTLYTERSNGVMPEYNPRTDTFDLGLDAMTSISKGKLNERMQRMKVIKGDEKEGEDSTGTEGKTE